MRSGKPAWLELKLASNLRRKEMGFYRYIRSKWKTKENVCLVLNEVSWWQRMGKRPRSLLGRFVLRNCSPLRLLEKPVTCEAYPWWKRIRLGNI